MAGAEPKPRLRSALLTAVWFGLAGPAIGTLVYAGWGSLASETSTTVGVSLLSGLWLLPFGYMLGLVPAAVSGLVAGLLGRDLRTAPFIGLSAAVGAATMGLVGLLDASEVEWTEGVANLAIMGGLAGGLTGALVRAVASRSRARA